MNSICTDIKSIETQNSVGKILKEARLKHKVRDLNVIADELCIRPHLLEALEKDDFGSFPSSCYAIGFIKNYSNYLGLDTKEIIARYEQEYAGSSQCVVLTFPEVEKRKGMPYTKLAGVATLCVAIFVGVWSSFDNLDAEEIAGFSSKINSPTISKVSSVQKENKPVIKTVAPMASSVAVKETKTAEPMATNVSDIRLKASEDVWVRISEQDGTVVVDKVLEKGQDLVAPKTSGLNLMTNNAAALSVTMGSKSVKSLGNEGQILDGVALEEKKLQELALLK